MATSTTPLKVLKNTEGYDAWFDQVKAKMKGLGLWEYMNPEANDNQPEPTRPGTLEAFVLKGMSSQTSSQSSDAATSASSASEHTLDAKTIWKARKDEHIQFLSLKDKASTYLHGVVEPTFHRSIDKEDTLLEKMKYLQKRLKPSKSERRRQLEREYAEVRAPPRTKTIQQWLVDWEDFVERVEQYSSTQFPSICDDFVKTIEKFDPTGAIVLESTRDRFGDKELPDISTLIDFYQSRARSRGDSSKTARNILAHATLQGKGPTDDEKEQHTVKQEKPDQRRTRKAHNPKRNNDRKTGGCSNITGKPENEQCAKLSDCNVVNHQKWPKESERDEKWHQYLANFKQYLADNKKFCESSATRFNNPIAKQIWEEKHAKPESKKEDDLTVTAATIISINAAAKTVNLNDLWICDNSAEGHVINDAFKANFKPTRIPQDMVISAGTTHFKVVAIGTCTLYLPRLDSKLSPIKLNLSNVALCPGFHVNIVAEPLLNNVGVWAHGIKNLLYSGEQPITRIKRISGMKLPFLDTETPSSNPNSTPIEWPTNIDGTPKTTEEAHKISVNAVQILKAKAEAIQAFPAQNSRLPLNTKALTKPQWHEVLGHAGRDRIEHLEGAVNGAKVIGTEKAPRANECQPCGESKAILQISRRPRRTLQTPYGEITMDLVELAKAYNGSEYMLHAYDLETCLHFVRDTMHKDQETLLSFFHELVVFARSMGREVMILHTDDDRAIGIRFRTYLLKNHIDLHQSAPYTQAQDPAERPGGVILDMARAMLAHSRLPHKLWPEIVAAAAYILNRLPVQKKH